MGSGERGATGGAGVPLLGGSCTATSGATVQLSPQHYRHVCLPARSREECLPYVTLARCAGEGNRLPNPRLRFGLVFGRGVWLNSSD